MPCNRDTLTPKKIMQLLSGSMSDVIIVSVIMITVVVATASIAAMVIVCRRYAWYNNVVQNLPVVRPRPLFTSSAV